MREVKDNLLVGMASMNTNNIVDLFEQSDENSKTFRMISVPLVNETHESIGNLNLKIEFKREKII